MSPQLQFFIDRLQPYQWLGPSSFARVRISIPLVFYFRLFSFRLPAHRVSFCEMLIRDVVRQTEWDCLAA